MMILPTVQAFRHFVTTVAQQLLLMIMWLNMKQEELASFLHMSLVRIIAYSAVKKSQS